MPHHGPVSCPSFILLQVSLMLCHEQCRNLLSTHACAGQKLMSLLCPLWGRGGECFPQKEHPKMLFIRYRSSYHLPILVAKWKIQTCIGCDIHSTWFLLLLLPLSKFPYQTDNLYTAFSTSCTFKDTQVKTWITCIPTPWFLELCVWTIGISVLVSGSEYLSLCKMIPQPHKLFAADTKIYLNKTSYCYMQPIVSGWSRMW